MGSLSNAVRATFEKITTGNIGEDLKEAGLAGELQKTSGKERRDPAFHSTCEFWFVWSRKKM